MLFSFLLILENAWAIQAPPTDWRYLPNGRLMLEDSYLDQPQCTIWAPAPPSTKRWVCTIARNSHPEGNFGEHSEVLYSEDEGLSWTTGIRLEAEGAPTNSYGNIGQSDFGRLYVIYNMNLNNVTRFPSGKPFSRDDELGFHVWRFSDDGGSSWSSDRLTIPVPNTAVDRNNTFNGATQIFWSVDQIKRTRAGGSLHAFTKIGSYMQSPPEESFFIYSPNINSERNASLVAWSVFPEGDAGVRPPCPTLGCMNWEEAHVVQLATQPGLYQVTRTSTGFLGAASTRDDSGAGGWGQGHYATFSALGLPAAAGRRVKNPEGPITLKRFANGKYLLLFYFNSVAGYTPPRTSNSTLRNPRNPYWLAAGWEEADGEVRFSQPEVALHFAPLGGPPASPSNSATGPGYPDFIEDGGRVFITETNKTQARVHPIDPLFLDTLFSADALNATAGEGIAVAFPPGSQGRAFPTPALPAFPQPPATAAGAGTGAVIGLWVATHSAAAPGQALVEVGGPLSLTVAAGGALLLELKDAATGTNASLLMDGECAARLSGTGTTPDSEPHYAAVVIDASARVLTWSVDGVVCDGSSAGGSAGGALWGWEWAPTGMGDLNANPRAPSFVLGGSYGGRVLGGAWYARALMHTELVGNWRAGPPAQSRGD